MESASGTQRSQQLKSRCIQRLALRVVPTPARQHVIRGESSTLYLPACRVSNASSPFSWFSPGPRTRNPRPPVDEHPHDPPRRRPIDNPLTVGGTTLGRWLREGRRGRIELLNARWHNAAGRHRPCSCPAGGAHIGINDRTEYRDGALHHLRCFAHRPL